MNDIPPDFVDVFGISRLPVSTPPEEVLERFNNELKHHLVAIRGCVQVLSVNPDEQSRQRVLEMIAGNLDKVESLRDVIRTYLELRAKKR